MSKRIWIPLGLISLLLVASFLVLNSTAPATEKSTCCKENLKACPPKPGKNSSGEMIIESLSHQFISFASFPY